MIDTQQRENQRLKQELADLRQTIFQVEPMVVYDGRFDKMIISPITAVTIARQLLQELGHLRQEMSLH
jgi:hypothetical protein